MQNGRHCDRGTDTSSGSVRCDKLLSAHCVSRFQSYPIEQNQEERKYADQRKIF